MESAAANHGVGAKWPVPPVRSQIRIEKFLAPRVLGGILINFTGQDTLQSVEVKLRRILCWQRPFTARRSVLDHRISGKTREGQVPIQRTAPRGLGLRSASFGICHPRPFTMRSRDRTVLEVNAQIGKPQTDVAARLFKL